MDPTIQALILGVVEGLTEFLPVSSTGHLLLADEILGFQGPPGKVFEIVVQLGAILAIVWLYRVRLFGAVVHAVSDVGARVFLRNVIVAFLPAMVLGAGLHGFIKRVLFNPWVVAVAFVVGGIAILVIERIVKTPRHHEIEGFSAPLSLKVGFCQTLAMIPGVSRSGATIMGGMLLGIDRKAAAEFSFFLAIPTMFGATVYDLYKSWNQLTLDGVSLIAIGFVTAFFVALVVVRVFITFISRHGFAPFAYYRIVVGLAALAVLAWPQFGLHQVAMH